MKYCYTTTELNVHGRKMIKICLPEGLEPIALFLNSDIGEENTARLFIDKIRKVQNGEVEFPYTLGGNTCVLDIRPNIVYVEEIFLKKRVVSIEPDEFIILIEACIMEKKKFQENNII